MLLTVICIHIDIRHISFNTATAETCNIEVWPDHLQDASGLCESDSVVDVGTVCVFTCKHGFTLHGNSTVSCQSDRVLSAPLPRCEGTRGDCRFISFQKFTLQITIVFHSYKNMIYVRVQGGADPRCLNRAPKRL